MSNADLFRLNVGILRDRPTAVTVRRGRPLRKYARWTRTVKEGHPPEDVVVEYEAPRERVTKFMEDHGYVLSSVSHFADTFTLKPTNKS